MTDNRISKNSNSILKRIEEYINRLDQSLKDSEQFLQYTSDTKEKKRLIQSVNTILNLIQDQLEAYNLVWNNLKRENSLKEEDYSSLKNIQEIERHTEDIRRRSNLIYKRSANIMEIYKALKEFDEHSFNSICLKLGINSNNLGKKNVDKELELLVQLLQESRIAELIDLVFY
jgi:hypothetical protein